jgi:hypothetical protein
MVFSTCPARSQAPSEKFIKNSCVDIARDWFRWNADDEAALPNQQFEKLIAPPKKEDENHRTWPRRDGLPIPSCVTPMAIFVCRRIM